MAHSILPGKVCQKAHDAGTWVHVDGAFDPGAAAAPERACLADGVADADSLATTVADVDSILEATLRVACK